MLRLLRRRRTTMLRGVNAHLDLGAALPDEHLPLKADFTTEHHDKVLCIGGRPDGQRARAVVLAGGACGLALEVRAVQGWRWGYGVRGLVFETMVSWLDLKGFWRNMLRHQIRGNPGRSSTVAFSIATTGTPPRRECGGQSPATQVSCGVLLYGDALTTASVICCTEQFFQQRPLRHQL